MDADGVDLAPALRRLYGTVPRARVTKLRGDASSRSYYRIAVDAAAAGDGPRELVAMRLPDESRKSEELGAGDAPSELPFVDVQRLLRERGIPVPEIYVDDTPGRVLLLEDLGDETFERRLLATPRERHAELYGQAVDLLVRMHRVCKQKEQSASIAYRRSFDRALLRSELDHFREWGLEALHGALAPADLRLLDARFDAIADALCRLAPGFVHRDYQSRNLMWASDGRLVVIDFQDALRGPSQYDLVALLCDSYVDLSEPLQHAMIERYARGIGLDDAARSAFAAGFWQLAVQRKLKDAGRFVFIDRVRGNPDFLQWYPQSLVYVGRALRVLAGGERENEQAGEALHALLTRVVPGFPDRTAVPAAVSRAG